MDTDIPANLEGRDSGAIPKIAAREAIAFAFRFLWTKLPQILRVVWLPLLIAWIVLYFAFDAYLDQLAIFIQTPNGRTASLALGLLFAGGFFALFCHAIVTVGVFNLAAGGAGGTWAWAHFRAVRSEWRVYAAFLRLFLIIAVTAGVLGFIVYDVAAMAGLSLHHIILLTGLTALIVTLAFGACPGLLLPAVAMSERGSILRRSAQESVGHVMTFTIIMIVLAAPGIALQTLGEYATPLLIPMKRFASDSVLAASAAEFRAVLPWYLCLTTLSFEITMTLMTAASYFIHREVGLSRHRSV